MTWPKRTLTGIRRVGSPAEKWHVSTACGRVDQFGGDHDLAQPNLQAISEESPSIYTAVASNPYLCQVIHSAHPMFSSTWPSQIPGSHPSAEFLFPHTTPPPETITDPQIPWYHAGLRELELQETPGARDALWECATTLWRLSLCSSVQRSDDIWKTHVSAWLVSRHCLRWVGHGLAHFDGVSTVTLTSAVS
jgi:hypothetical protein